MKTETETLKLQTEIRIGFYLRPGNEVTKFDQIAIDLAIDEFYKSLTEILKKRALTNKFKIKVSR